MGYIKTALKWGKKNVLHTAERALKVGDGINRDIEGYAVEVIPLAKQVDKLYRAAYAALKKGDFKEMERLEKKAQADVEEINRITKRMSVGAKALVNGRPF